MENVTDKNDDFTDLSIAQIEANSKLSRWLIWMEDRQIEFLTSHHQFNEDKEFEGMLEKFALRHLQKKYRTRERKDIGNANLQKLVKSVNEFGYSVDSRFSSK